MPKARPSNGSRFWCFTINNPTDDDNQQLADLMSNDLCTYLCYGRETGESETPHYQAYIELLVPNDFLGLRNDLKELILNHASEAAPRQETTASRKISTQSNMVSGSPIAKGKGMTSRFFTEYRAMHAMERDAPTKVYVFHGPTASGKTRAAFDMNCHQMDYIAPFFTDPQNAPVLLFDDVHNPVNLFGRRLFLRITDRYPMKVRCLGKYVEWNPTVIIFTTNDDPNTWNLDAACRRRIDEIIAFPLDKGGLDALPACTQDQAKPGDLPQCN
ncbi:replication-associated protein [Avon-Heathcote Estuary associated circular virus 21]|uniref:replication-associated protein n=1 Tax=Avon-Heathcote Estuary associated circular virus 21 TaxID=1618245 RepID=UPI0005CCA3C8|nr:replication-associated protein [Avon-Heathcote Estuary associated circular virus 21]AJP36452.1 replication-associated protein [Avon-Heathcote Estuary associated circular virus 21]